MVQVLTRLILVREATSLNIDYYIDIFMTFLSHCRGILNSALKQTTDIFDLVSLESKV